MLLGEFFAGLGRLLLAGFRLFREGGQLLLELLVLLCLHLKALLELGFHLFGNNCYRVLACLCHLLGNVTEPLPQSVRCRGNLV